MHSNSVCTFWFFFNDTATTEIYTLSLHDALPISRAAAGLGPGHAPRGGGAAHLRSVDARAPPPGARAVAGRLGPIRGEPARGRGAGGGGHPSRRPARTGARRRPGLARAPRAHRRGGGALPELRPRSRPV